MLITTKKTTLSPNNYLKIMMKEKIKTKWWIFLISLTIASPVFILHNYWFIIIAVIFPSLYLGFWALQYYGVRYVEQARILFSPLNYELSQKNITMKLSSTKGMPFPWDQIKFAKQNKKAFILFISSSQIIYLPFKAFYNKNDVEFLTFILKNKRLINHNCISKNK